ncbi:MAG: 1-deoxy-D-xylulose-5-phosphate reductoisomerase [Pseudomonadota bacterium]|nr:1-deoxy-D-xylulose-5-phosphate reductoisomerase [Pseudomonadota bacterium]
MIKNDALKRIAPKRLTILGSTGSIGRSTIELIELNPGIYEVEALTANQNVTVLAEQARRLGARFAAVADPEKYNDLKTTLSGTSVEVAAGPRSILDAAARESNWVMAAIVGAVGLEPTLQAIQRGAIVALANKEALVCAGDLMLNEAERCGGTLLPVDSEHNAIFQVFDFERREAIEKLILTASGGPFRNRSRVEMHHVTPADAVAHPNWDMGPKISVDSATMMNKGLELIEAHFLFGIPENRIEILIHPQSIIHSLVEYVDGSVLAQLGTPDMKTPISYTLAWPERMRVPGRSLDFGLVSQLTFEAPDLEQFPALSLAREALKTGGSAPAILNAANEEAVAAFLGNKVGFLEIPRIVSKTMENVLPTAIGTVEDVLSVDAITRRVTQNIIVDL